MRGFHMKLHFINQIKCITVVLCLDFLTSLTCGMVPCSHFSLIWRRPGLVFGPEWVKGQWEEDKWSSLSPTPWFWQACKPSRPHTHTLVRALNAPHSPGQNVIHLVSCLLHKRASNHSLKPWRGSFWCALGHPQQIHLLKWRATGCQSRIGGEVTSRTDAWKMLTRLPAICPVVWARVPWDDAYEACSLGSPSVMRKALHPRSQLHLSDSSVTWVSLNFGRLGLDFTLIPKRAFIYTNTQEFEYADLANYCFLNLLCWGWKDNF